MYYLSKIYRLLQADQHSKEVVWQVNNVRVPKVGCLVNRFICLKYPVSRCFALLLTIMLSRLCSFFDGFSLSMMQIPPGVLNKDGPMSQKERQERRYFNLLGFRVIVEFNIGIFKARLSFFTRLGRES